MQNNKTLKTYGAPVAAVQELRLDAGLCQSKAGDVSLPSLFEEDDLFDELS